MGICFCCLSEYVEDVVVLLLPVVVLVLVNGEHADPLLILRRCWILFGTELTRSGVC